MKRRSFILGTSILLLILVSHWNFVNAVNPTNSTIVITPANATVLENNTNVSQPRTPLLFSQDASIYIDSNLSGR